MSAVDTMLIERDDKWWMFDPSGWEDHSLELCVFSASSPLATEWKPHPGKPFSIDSSRARNGGIIREGNQVFRVSQGKEFDMYGKKTSVNEIVDLNDIIYSGRFVGTITPSFKKGIAGTHHLHSVDALTILDFAHEGRAR